MHQHIILPLLAALLLPACGCRKTPCPQRYNPPTAPTRPICPESKPKCGCKGKKKPAVPSSRPARAVTLSTLQDYLPGLPPGYWSL